MIDKLFDNQTIQNKIDDIAEKAGVKSVLIMKSHDNEMEVVLSGGDEGKEIYQAKDKGKKSSHPQGEHALYCEKVVNDNEMLHVADARVDEDWKNNEDLTEFGLASYVGLPIEENGKVVGTVCMLNDEAIDIDANNNDYDAVEELKKLKSNIEELI